MFVGFFFCIWFMRFSLDIGFWYLDVGYLISVCVYGFEIWILDILDMGI